jgi:hypothetical protein
MRSHFEPPPPPLPDPVTFIRTATVVLDTCALLELYRYSIGTREGALDALSAVRDSLWMPDQVGVEFFRHRDANCSELSRAYDSALAALDEARNAVRAAFGDGRQFEESRDPVDRKVGRTIRDLKSRVKKLRSDDRAVITVDNDPVLDRLNDLYDGRWPKKPDADTTRKRVEDFHAWRVPNKIPPGFKDASKSNSGSLIRAAGDYLIWAEILAQAAESQTDVLFVTIDMKPDWWDKTGSAPRPRRELVEEFLEQTGQSYHQVTLSEFIEVVETAYDVPVDDAVVEEITEIEEHDRSLDSIRRAVQSGIEFAELQRSLQSGIDFAELRRSLQSGIDFAELGRSLQSGIDFAELGRSLRAARESARNQPEEETSDGDDLGDTAEPANEP